jgi:hypothetical protein
VDVRFDRNDPPRQYEVGWGEKFLISDCGRLVLEPDEQVTFTTPDGGELDVTRKDWGFYATPSINARLIEFGLRTVLVRNKIGRYFVLLVERGKEPLFEEYVRTEELTIVAWMDTDEALERLSGAASA